MNICLPIIAAIPALITSFLLFITKICLPILSLVNTISVNKSIPKDDYDNLNITNNTHVYDTTADVLVPISLFNSTLYTINTIGNNIQINDTDISTHVSTNNTYIPITNSINLSLHIPVPISSYFNSTHYIHYTTSSTTAATTITSTNATLASTIRFIPTYSLFNISSLNRRYRSVLRFMSNHNPTLGCGGGLFLSPKKIPQMNANLVFDIQGMYPWNVNNTVEKNGNEYEKKNGKSLSREYAKEFDIAKKVLKTSVLWVGKGLILLKQFTWNAVKWSSAWIYVQLNNSQYNPVYVDVDTMHMNLNEVSVRNVNFKDKLNDVNGKTANITNNVRSSDAHIKHDLNSSNYTSADPMLLNSTEINQIRTDIFQPKLRLKSKNNKVLSKSQ
jgi:hypothetical protein